MIEYTSEILIDNKPATLSTIVDITERKRAEEALAERTRHLEALRAIATESVRELDRGSLLAQILQRAVTLAGAASGTIFLWDPDDQVLVPHTWQGRSNWPPGTRLRLDEGATGQAARRRRISRSSSMMKNRAGKAVRRA